MMKKIYNEELRLASEQSERQTSAYVPTEAVPIHFYSFIISLRSKKEIVQGAWYKNTEKHQDYKMKRQHEKGFASWSNTSLLLLKITSFIL